MANHKSSLKRIRQEQKRRLHNRYYAKAMRAAVRKLRATTEKSRGRKAVPRSPEDARQAGKDQPHS